MVRTAKVLSITIVISILLGLLLACGAPAAAPTAETKKLRVALLMPGSISDASFNAMAYEGLMAIKDEFNADVAYSEAVPVADFDETYRSYSEQGYDIIIGHGFEFGAPAAKIAPEFPHIHYLVTNSNVSGPNLASLEPLFEEPCFVAGALAGYMTKANKVGSIGGMEFPIIVRGIEAFIEGAKYANPNVEGNSIYIGTLDDVAKGKEAALAQISAGTDVIFQIANEAGAGVIQACQEKGVYAVGFGYDQNELAPQTVLTSFTVSYRNLLVAGVRRVLDGTFEGTIQQYGLGTGVMDLSPYHGLVPDDVAAKVDQVRQDVISGKVKVPRYDVPPNK